MELNLLLTLDLREQASLQAELVTRGAPDALVTLALTGACRIGSLAEARNLREWLAQARVTGGDLAQARVTGGDLGSLQAIERALMKFGL